MCITDIEAIEMSRKLAEYHKDLAIEAALWKGVRPFDLFTNITPISPNGSPLK